jgi:hypothetical protein
VFGTISALGAVMAMVFAAGCGGLQPVDPVQALRDGGAATAKLKTVNATLSFTKGTVSFRGYKLVSAKAAVRLPDESDTTYTVRQQDVQFALEVVITGGRVFLTVPLLGPTELTGTEAATIPDLAKLFDPNTGLPAVIPAGRNPSYVKVDSVDGVDSHEVKVTYTADQVHGMLPQLTSASDIAATVWIGGSDHFIRKAVLDGNFGDNNAESAVEVDMSGFNQPVVIASPTP